MRKILSKSHQRQLSILEVLLEMDDYISIHSLSKLLGASERTISEDISYLRSNYSDMLSLTISRKNGIKLENQSISNMEAVFRSIFNESFALEWIRELIIHPYESIEFYEKILFMSKSTLLRTLPRINHFLKTHGMMINTTNGKYSFTGKDEAYLRDFSASFLLELYGLKLEKLDIRLDIGLIAQITLRNLKQAVSPENFEWVSTDDITLVYRIMFYVISLIREDTGFHLVSSYDVSSEVSPEEMAIIKYSFRSITKEKLSPIHEYLYNNQSDIKKFDPKDFVLEEQIDDYIQRTFKRLNFSLDDTMYPKIKYVVQGIYYKAKLRPYETSLLFNRIHYFVARLRKNNRFLYDVIHEETTKLSEVLGTDLSNQIDNMIFWCVLVEPAISKVSLTKKALLFSDFGSMHSRFLQKSLEDFFETTCSKLSFTLADPMREYSREDLEEYAVVISTTSRMNIPHDNICYIGDYLELSTYAQILDALHQK